MNTARWIHFILVMGRSSNTGSNVPSSPKDSKTKKGTKDDKKKNE